MTVGDVITLKCPVSELKFNSSQAAIKLAKKEDEMKIALLKVDLTDPKNLRVELTSYKPGEHQFENIEITDGTQNLFLGGMSLQVASVINPQEPVSEPYGPKGPISLSLSAWVWGSFLILLVLIAVFLVQIFRRKALRQKQLESMRVHDQALAPYSQFHQVLRKLSRENIALTGGGQQQEDPPEAAKKLIIEEFRKAYLFYLARVFLMPTDFMSERKIVKEIKNSLGVRYPNVSADLKKSLSELNRAQKAQSISGKDLRALLNLIKKSAEQINQEKP